MAGRTYAQWFDALTPVFELLQRQGYVFAPEARRDAAMNALGNQHLGASVVKAVVVDTVMKGAIATPGGYRIPCVQVGALHG